MRRKLILLFILIISTVSANSCSPFYVIRAGYEESKILLSRKKISAVIEDKKTSEKDKQKLRLVLAAREFAKELGLKPEDSFTQYSKIDRDVLVWVLIAAPKTSLEPHTWWFPIVGRFPYKGFFEKEDALKEFDNLKEKDLDLYLRPSAAFSTLGWFNDPLLSTTLAFDELSLVNTVIHEITHNTVWIKNNAAFNETLAHAVGSLASIQFFEKTEGANSLRAKRATELLAEDLEFAKFLKQLKIKLQKVYTSDKNRQQKLSARDQIFAEAKSTWRGTNKNHYNLLIKNLNNAVILAQSTYLDRPELFLELFAKCDQSISCMISKVAAFKNKDKPYKLLEIALDEERISK